ncbi:MAG: hypothetical protein J2P31_05360 [Blastocatellia bacterium]|nr:hypothetical protein [Blastocatellia bacterium]
MTAQPKRKYTLEEYFELNDIVYLKSMDCQLELNLVYREITFSPDNIALLRD